MARKILGGKRYWKFEPDPILTQFKHHNPKKIAHMQKTILEARPKEGQELTHKGRDKVHPTLRDRLPAGSTRADFDRVAETLDHAEKLSAAGLHGAHFYPAVVDTSLLTQEHSHEGIYSVKTFLDIPGHKERLFMPITYVQPRIGGNYFVEAYGMQYSDPRNKAKKAKDLARDMSGGSPRGYLDVRNDVPKGLHRTFDTGAPVLGLSLTSALLRKAGAGTIGLTGNDLQWWRKGTRRPQALKELKGHMNSLEPGSYARERLQYAIDNWEDIRGPGVRNVLREVAEKTGQKYPNVFGISKTLLDRNYRRTLEHVGAREITAREALGPTAAMHLSFMWGVPEPEKLLGLRAYDMNIPKLDALHPFLKPMTEKEVADWKKNMVKRGHDIDKITSMM